MGQTGAVVRTKSRISQSHAGECSSLLPVVTPEAPRLPGGAFSVVTALASQSARPFVKGEAKQTTQKQVHAPVHPGLPLSGLRGSGRSAPSESMVSFHHAVSDAVALDPAHRPVPRREKNGGRPAAAARPLTAYPGNRSRICALVVLRRWRGRRSLEPPVALSPSGCRSGGQLHSPGCRRRSSPGRLPAGDRRSTSRRSG